MYDAIVVGARCAGSPTAMLLARRGHRVLLVDRAEFPSDTLSTHYIHQPGIASLDRWGLRARVAASGSPPIRDYRVDFGPVVLEGTPPPAGDVADAHSVRRHVLDEILVRAAERAGAEVRERFAVQELVFDDGRVAGIRGRSAGGAEVIERAAVVIGADGMNSHVAHEVHAGTYRETPSLTCAYYSYWSGVDLDHVELYARPGRMVGAAPTNDGAVLVIAFWPRAEFQDIRRDVDRHFAEALELAPALAERLAAGERAERYRGSGSLHNFFRNAHGDGWALVGDAGYHKDPILALGITDAFRDAELLAGALDSAFGGRQTQADALAGYWRRRDELAGPGFEATLEFARLEPPPAEMQALLGALAGDQAQTDRFLGTFAGTVSRAEFFDPANLARIAARAPALATAR